MVAYTADDHRYMARAMQLAERGIYTTHPNPRVGCVLVRDGSVVGEGWHRKAGEPHAEVEALRDAGDAARGATVYVTLEPCAHTGRTGPCATALIEAGVARVVCAIEDPFPAVAGKGLRQLRAAGIECVSGLMQDTARRLNRGFLSRIGRGRPFLRLKVAASLDGATAMSSGESQWITGDAARRDVQRWRAQSDAVLSGIGTVLADDPRLTVRGVEGHVRQPLRVVVDSRLRTPSDAALFREAGDVLVFGIQAAGRERLEAAGAVVETVAAVDGRCRLDAVFGQLALRGINEVLVECGPELAGALLSEGLVDEVLLYQAPVLLGSETRRSALTPLWQLLSDGPELQVIDRRQFGRDTRIIATPRTAR